MTHNLLVGITARDDESALELCLASLARTLDGVEHEVVVVDAGSTDRTCEVARGHGARLVERPWNQADALNYLIATSDAEYTLLLHSDVVLLADDWYERVAGQDAALVAPDDSGLGPHLRAGYGSGKPESSFLFWRTADVRRLRRLTARNALRAVRERLPYVRAVDLSDRHVTHNLPRELERARLRWRPMKVLASPAVDCWFPPERVPPGAAWDPAWGTLEYGFGNFYALDGTITHFHQWYSRFSGEEGDALNDDGVPVAYLADAAARFRRDLAAGTVRLPLPR